MIKFSAAPAKGPMALVTRLGELTLVGIIILVAADTAVARLAERLIGLVAACARERTVCTLQRELRLAMVKLCAVEFHDVLFATLVLGVAGTAFTG